MNTYSQIQICERILFMITGSGLKNKSHIIGTYKLIGKKGT